MGIEYALVCEGSQTAYELGKGGWSDLVSGEGRQVLMSMPEEIRRAVFSAMEDFEVTQVYRERVCDDVLRFVREHPGPFFLRDDCCGDYLWCPNPLRTQDERAYYDGIYQQVGTRYQ